jgi:hypothetical protein
LSPEPPVHTSGPAAHIVTRADIIRRVPYWTLPCLFCLALYWHGLKAWFQMDDFAWLGLHTLVHDWNSFLDAMFRPMAQGTVRPLSERLFFFGFWHLFGMEALPYRALVFATAFASIILISVIVRRLTASALAGFLAPLLWVVSPALYEPMTWTSAYNQILCAFFFLLQLYLLIRYIDTRRRRYYATLWLVFLLGFGVLELNVVFPAIAAMYALLFARRYLLHVAPMFLVSIAYAIWHRTAGQMIHTSIYAMDLRPQSLFKVFWNYVELSFSAQDILPLRPELTPAIQIAFGLVLSGLIVFVALMLRRRAWLVLIFVAWYLITLSIYLPLANHVSGYYATVPMVGLAMLGGWAIAVAWERNRLTRILAVTIVLCFAIPGAWQGRQLSRRVSLQSRDVRHMVRGIASAHKKHPNQILVLTGVDNDLFWFGLFDKPEVALGWRGLYVTGETEQKIIPAPEMGSVADRFLADSVTLEAIHRGQAEVYDVSQTPVKNVTKMYERALTADHNPQLPRSCNVASPLFARFLKDGWFPVSDGARWTAKQATVELRGPAHARGTLTITGVVTPLHTGNGPYPVSAWVDGRSIGKRDIPAGASRFSLTYDLPDDVAGKQSVAITVGVDRTVSAPPDERELGLLMGTFEITP